MPVYCLLSYKQAEISNERALTWCNRYTVASDDSWNIYDQQAFAATIVEAERWIHGQEVLFIRQCVLDCGAAGSSVVARAVMSEAGPLQGRRGGPGVGDNLGYLFGLLCNKNAKTGRTGRILYRGCIHSGDLARYHDGSYGIANTSTLLQQTMDNWRFNLRDSGFTFLVPGVEKNGTIARFPSHVIGFNINTVTVETNWHNFHLYMKDKTKQFQEGIWSMAQLAARTAQLVNFPKYSITNEIVMKDWAFIKRDMTEMAGKADSLKDLIDNNQSNGVYTPYDKQTEDEQKHVQMLDDGNRLTEILGQISEVSRAFDDKKEIKQWFQNPLPTAEAGSQSVFSQDALRICNSCEEAVEALNFAPIANLVPRDPQKQPYYPDALKRFLPIPIGTNVPSFARNSRRKEY